MQEEPSIEAIGHSESSAGALAVWLGFSALCLGMFMAVLDIQIVATSLPDIQSGLGIAPSQMSWIQTAYLIAEIITIPLTGRLTRIFGLRYLGIGAIIGFACASALCAASSGFVSLILGRILQGLAGGCLIPAVFSAVFLIFPDRRQALATGIAGSVAVLAPAIGPLIGGWITDTYSWHWLFLINIVPAAIAAAAVFFCFSARRVAWSAWRHLDWTSVAMMAVSLACLEIALKEAPQRGWLAWPILPLWLGVAIPGALFCRRSWRADHPVVDLHLLRRPDYATGCCLSFILGIGLFGASFLMPVFLGFVRLHSAFEIGQVMLITGVAQLLIAPVAVWLERQHDRRFLSPYHLSLAGFLALTCGLALSAFATFASDFDQMFWPQVVRGIAFMFCLLPPTRLALDRLPPAVIADGSALFNLMRNLGGAIGLAVIDTIIWQRAPVEAHHLVTRLMAGDAAAARFVGLDTDRFVGKPIALPDQATQDLLRPAIERAGLVMAINEAWAVIALAALIGVVIACLAGAGSAARKNFAKSAAATREPA
ncbi:MAG TPA: DHA2 family efflux MFS transporter permease subunit [Dongiaceae bacterium]|nr:DHA2 family efflux MFS transporter permease subunit [Dongiaceae bacterium]